MSEQGMTKEKTITEVFMICDAYESGVGHGLQRDRLVNPYDKLSKLHEAYAIGYDLGHDRMAATRSADDVIERLQSEVERLRAFEWMYKELQK